MPIVSSRIKGTIQKPLGRRALLLEVTDQVGEIYLRKLNVPEDNDDALSLSEWSAETEIELPNYEARASARSAKSGELITPVHQTQPELDKSTISLLMQIEDSLEFSQSLQWFRDFEVRAGANNNARASYLGVSNADYGLVATRYNQITGLVDGLEADAARVWDKLEVW